MCPICPRLRPKGGQPHLWAVMNTRHRHSSAVSILSP
nr:MAG TPA: Rad50 zinc hook motif [Caudoviricetes sp.]